MVHDSKALSITYTFLNYSGLIYYTVKPYAKSKLINTALKVYNVYVRDNFRLPKFKRVLHP
jgi:hypothetical protein